MTGNGVTSNLVSHESERQYRRYDVDFDVHVKAWRGGAMEVAEGHGTDVSVGGLALKTAAKLQPGETVTIEMILPITGYKVMITGAIRNQENGQYGVEFVGLGEMQRNMIDRLCAVLEQNRRR